MLECDCRFGDSCLDFVCYSSVWSLRFARCFTVIVSCVCNFVSLRFLVWAIMIAFFGFVCWLGFVVAGCWVCGSLSLLVGIGLVWCFDSLL